MTITGDEDGVWPSEFADPDRYTERAPEASTPASFPKSIRPSLAGRTLKIYVTSLSMPPDR
jgi:hypothetical protein